MFTKVKNKVKRLYDWQKEADVLRLLPILWLAHGLLFFLEPTIRKPVFTLSSATLQIAGGLIVLWQLNEAVTKYKNKSILQGGWSWLKRCPLWCNSEEKKHGSTHIEGTARVHAVGHAIHSQSTEEHIQQLYKRVRELDQGVSEVKAELREEIAKVNSESNRNIKNTQVELQDALLGNVHWEIFGVFIVIQGTIMGAMSNL